MHFIYIVPCSCYGKYVSCTTGTNFTPIRFYSNGVGVSQMLTPPVFTFQFGFILMERISSISISLNYFTFQSGFILMQELVKNYIFNIVVLYIPIWFYSNCSKKHLYYHVLCFTFQSGFILIKCGCEFKREYPPLHSNLVLF